jgi:hypothetical protein
VLFAPTRAHVRVPSTLHRSARALSIALLVTGSTACTSTARLSGRWVLLTGNTGIAVGQSDQPSGGGPLHLVPGSAAPGACLPSEEYERAFGGTCPHEPEGDAPGIEDRVRWYCHGDLAVRVRLEPCERRDRLRVVEIAVATRGR